MNLVNASIAQYVWQNKIIKTENQPLKSKTAKPIAYGRVRFLLANTFTHKTREKRPMKVLGQGIRITKKYYLLRFYY